MDTLMRLREGIPKLIEGKMSLFESFEQVFLFGSALDCSIVPNDIDILVIYTEYSSQINVDLRRISDELEKEIGYLCDFTVLSVEEEKETAFLERIGSKCLKIK